MSNRYTVEVRIRPAQSTAQTAFTSVSQKLIKQMRAKSMITYAFDTVYDQHITNKEIFQGKLQNTIRRGLSKGIHTTILAYGQTGSGKTHTLFGHKGGGIADEIIHIIMNNLLNVKCGFLQVYQQKVFDLIGGQRVQLREDGKGNMQYEGLNIYEVKTQEEVQYLLAKAHSNKVFGHSYVHSESSRSHVLCMFQVNDIKFNIVDLCGSQVLTYDYDKKQRSQTSIINLSLFALQGVVADLTSGEAKGVSFRNSILTRILKSSLIDSSKSQVHLFCCISPETKHQDLSASTLRFGQLAIQIDQTQNTTTVVNLSQQKRKLKTVSNVIDINMPKMNQFYKKLPSKWNTSFIKIFKNQIKVYQLQTSQKPRFNILSLHAYGGGCDGSDLEYFLGFIAPQLSCNFYSVDFPGFGESSGHKFTSRAENFVQKQGPIQFMVELFKVFNFSSKNKVVLFGYDLGGAIALSSAMNRQLNKSIEAVVAFHPTWTDDVQKLAVISLPVLLLWFPIENFHLISAGLRIVKSIKGAILHKFNVGAYTQQKASGLYYNYSQALSQSIVGWLTELRPQIIEKQKQKQKRGGAVTQTIIVDISEKQKRINSMRQAVSEYYNLMDSKQHKKVSESIVKGGENKPKFLRLACELPLIDPRSVSWQMLYEAQIIKQLPKNTHLIQEWKQLPFFQLGKQLHVRTTIILNALDPMYLHYSTKGELGITHFAKVSAQQSEQQIISTEKIKVNVINDQEKIVTISVSLIDTLELNLPTCYTRDRQGNYIFEDSVVCKYEAPLLKLKFVQILRKFSEDIDFSNEFHKQQKKCVEYVYEAMDLRHLVNEGIDNTRYTGTAVDRLAYFGQGNCHHLASVMAALLLPFGKLMGFTVLFRAGSFLKNGRQLDNEDKPLPNWNGKVNNAVQDHTWLEVVYSPSAQIYVCDPSFGLCNIPLQQIYSLRGKMHISGKKPNFSITATIPEKLY